jgi:hypothetical protein
MWEHSPLPEKKYFYRGYDLGEIVRYTAVTILLLFQVALHIKQLISATK